MSVSATQGGRNNVHDVNNRNIGRSVAMTRGNAREILVLRVPLLCKELAVVCKA